MAMAEPWPLERDIDDTHVQLSVSPAHSHPLVLLLLGQLAHSHLPGAHLHSGSQLHAFLSPPAPPEAEAAAEEEEDSPVLLGQLAQVQVDPQAQLPSAAQLHEPVAGTAGAEVVVLQQLQISIWLDEYQRQRKNCEGRVVAKVRPFKED